MSRSADNAATVHSTDEACTEAAAPTRLQAQHLLDVRSNQLGIQMTFSHKVRDVDAIIESLLDAVIQHACGRSSQVAGYILSPATLDDSVLNGL